jgi:RNA polymerase sigma-70 factor (ECF subfamily)
MTPIELSHLHAPAKSSARPSCAELYEEYFDFVWRNAARLGVPEGVREDLVHDVFVVVHRKLAEFEGRSSARTWLYGILTRVVLEHRRNHRLRFAKEAEAAADRELVTSERVTEDLARKEATDIVDAILQQMDEDKRTIFVLVELEELSVAEAARGLAINLNTAHARLRAARMHFAEVVQRLHAKSMHDQAPWRWRRRP